MRLSRCCLHAALISGVAVGVAAGQIGGGDLTVPFAIYNSATQEAGPLVAGSAATMYGNFSGATEQTGTVPLPKTLGGVQVMVGDQAASLAYVSERQINLVIPRGVAEPRSTVSVVVNGERVGQQEVEIRANAPAIYVQSGGAARPAVAINADGRLNADSARAGRGSTVTLLATGIGEDVRRAQVGVMLGLIRVPARSITADPGYPGVWRIVLTVPENAEQGQVPVAMYAGNGTSNTATLFVE